MVIQQVPLEIVRTPETAQAVKVLNTVHMLTSYAPLDNFGDVHPIQCVGLEPNKLKT